MLTYAIGFIQNVQLICFAIVFVLMALHDRNNRSLRWLAYAYLAGLVGGIAGLSGHLLPLWLRVSLEMEATPIAYGCMYAGIALFVGRGSKVRWVTVAMAVAALPFYLVYSMRGDAGLAAVATLNDLVLAAQTTLSAWLLLSTVEPVTQWARRTMGGFFVVYAAVEYARVVVYLATGQMPDAAAPWIEVASGVVYVVSCSLSPLAFIWMLNARLHANLNREMVSDPLTHLINRRGLQMAGALELARYERFGQGFALVIADLDHFKQVNDTFGHAGGDLVLIRAAEVLQTHLRQSDILGRHGGEEFVLLLPGTDAAGATQMVERLRVALEASRVPLGVDGLQVTSSFGITWTAGRKQLGWEKLMREADTALYAAKSAGRNALRLYEIDATPAAGAGAPDLGTVSGDELTDRFA